MLSSCFSPDVCLRCDLLSGLRCALWSVCAVGLPKEAYSCKACLQAMFCTRCWNKKKVLKAHKNQCSIDVDLRQQHLETADAAIVTRPSLRQLCLTKGCENAATKWCSFCGVAGYCGATCQRKDWDNVHKHGECAFFAKEIRPIKKVMTIFEMREVLTQLKVFKKATAVIQNSSRTQYADKTKIVNSITCLIALFM
jgi:hypothetical protein